MERDVASASRWRMLALLSAAELLAMTLWFSATAVAPQLAAEWGLGAGGAAWLTMAVQLGFVAGALASAALSLADLWSARNLFAAAAVLGAAANGLVVLAPGAAAAFALRFLTGVLLAGVYPPAMKMAATWFRAERGLAIGILVGALTVGTAVPHLARAFGTWAWQGVVLVSSACALVAAGLVVLGYRDGPFVFPQPPFSLRHIARVVRVREYRLATFGYLGHMWELYACWTLVALFFLHVYQRAGATAEAAGARAAVIAFAVIGMGGVGAALAGQWADRLGRERITIWAMAVSGACALVIGWLALLPPWALAGLALVWGFAVVADSAQFSALVTEVAPKDAVGTALTLQTSLGFLLTVFSIRLAVELSGRFGWGLAFSTLAIGPALGIRAMTTLRRARAGASHRPGPG